MEVQKSFTKNMLLFGSHFFLINALELEQIQNHFLTAAAAARKCFMPSIAWAFIADAVSESNIDPNVTFFETYGCNVVFFTSSCSLP